MKTNERTEQLRTLDLEYLGIMFACMIYLSAMILKLIAVEMFQTNQKKNIVKLILKCSSFFTLLQPRNSIYFCYIYRVRT